MCGIVGYVGDNSASPILIDGLKKLEYRGYDSAGIAVCRNGKITTVKTKGRISDLQQKLDEVGTPQGSVGIGHTRWATHGAPTDANAHPHSGLSGRVTLVHNGIIENYLELKAELEKQGKASDFVMGFEESYGYLAGTHARDKDAVVASMLICEMAAYYKSQGKTLIDVMNGLYDEFGYYCNTVQSYTFEGAAGMEKMAAIMDGLRDNKPSSFAGYEVTKIDDYKTSKSTIVKTGEESEITLPKSNVLAYTLTNGNKVIVRPSGTEPKIKAYITAIGQSEENAKEIAQRLLNDANELMK